MKNPDRPSREEYLKNYRERKAKERKEYNAKWYLENKEKHRRLNSVWQKQNPDRMREIRTRWRDANPDKSLLHNAKMRANALGLPFNITVEDVVIPEQCPVLGVKLCWIRGRGRTQPDTPSLDRMNPSLGYVKGNVRVISWRANCLKRDGTLEEFEAIVAYMRAAHSDE